MWADGVTVDVAARNTTTPRKGPAETRAPSSSPEPARGGARVAGRLLPFQKPLEE